MSNTAVLDVLDTRFGECPRCDAKMLRFEGGWGCSSCPAWIPLRRAMEEHVEKDPARPIDLSEAVKRIRFSIADEAPSTLPALPPAPRARFDPSVYDTPPTPMSEEIDLVTRITSAMLPVVREDVPLTQILQVAQSIARLKA